MTAKARLALALACVAAGVLASCATVASNKTVLADKAVQRAAFETACPPASLETTWLGPSTVGVEGCGKRLVYVYTDCSYKSVGLYVSKQMIENDCTPILNTESHKPGT